MTKSGIVTIVVIAISVVLTILMKGGKRLTRGMRNNNPFNIIRTTDNWQGMSQRQTDTRFVVFNSLDYGVRAGLINLYNAYFSQGLTLMDLIYKYAPPFENNSLNYVRAVSDLTGVGVQSVPRPTDYLQIALAIVRVEQGYQAVTREQMIQVINKFNLSQYSWQ